MNDNILVRIGADISAFTSGIRSANGDLQSFGQNASQIGSGMAKAFGGAALAIGAGLGFAVKEAASFDTQIRKAGAIAGASAKELDAMKASALDLGAKTSESASSVANAMTEMAAKGFTANQTIAAMPGIIAAAEASGEDLALAADTVSSALNIWGLEAAESSRVADVLAMSANVSAAGIDDLGYVLKYAGGPAAALGISLEEVAAAAGIMTNAGLDGSNAGTALRASILALNNPAKAQQKMMANLGISMRDTEGNALSLSEMVQNLSERTAHMSEADKVATLAKLVGTEAVSGFLSLIKAGPAEIDKMTLSLQNSGGAAAETAAQMKDGIGGALENLSGAFESLTIMIGDQLVPYVQMAAEWLAALADKFTAMSEGTMKFLVIGTAIVGIFSAIAAGIGIALMVVGSIITSLGTLAGALGIAGGAGGLLSAVFAALTGPIAIAVAAIAGVIAVLVLAYKKVDWFRDMVNAAWAKIKELTVIAFEAVKQAVIKAVEAVLAFVKPQLDKFKAFWDENGKQIESLVKIAFESVVVIIKGVMSVIKGIFEVVWPIISATVKAAWETIKLVISSAIDIVLGVVKAGLQLLQGDWKGALSTLLQVLKNIWGNVETFLKGINLAETGKDIIRGLINGIKSMGNAIKDTVSELAGKLPEWVKKILGIKSPSRVMAELGVFTGQGLANGIVSTQKVVKDAITGVTNVIKSVTKASNAEINAIAKSQAEEEKAVQQKKAKDIANIHAVASSNKRKLTISEKQRIEKIETDSNASLIAIQRKHATETAKVEADMSKAKIEAIKTYVADKKSLEQLSLVAETEVWRQSMSQFKVGTKERVEAQKAYQTSLKAVNDAIVSTNEEYAGKMTTINDNLRKQEEELTATYTKSLNDRMTSLMSFAGIFDAFDATVAKSGTELLSNLNSQVDGFKLWQSEITKLSGKAIDEGLLAELRAMGPKALPELLALNSLTDTQLTQYSALYAEKAKLARTQAEAELIGMKTDTATRITELRATANKELAVLQTEWTAKIKAVTKATDDEFMSLIQIGKNAGQNLLDGLKSMEGALVAQATAIAQAVNAALQTSLGGSVNVESYSPPTTNASSTAKATSSTSTTKASSGGVTQNITINSTTPLSPAEIARKNKQAAQQLAMEWR